ASPGSGPSHLLAGGYPDQGGPDDHGPLHRGARAAPGSPARRVRLRLAARAPHAERTNKISPQACASRAVAGRSPDATQATVRGAGSVVGREATSGLLPGSASRL